MNYFNTFRNWTVTVSLLLFVSPCNVFGAAIDAAQIQQLLAEKQSGNITQNILATAPQTIDVQNTQERSSHVNSRGFKEKSQKQTSRAVSSRQTDVTPFKQLGEKIRGRTQKAGTAIDPDKVWANKRSGLNEKQKSALETFKKKTAQKGGAKYRFNKNGVPSYLSAQDLGEGLSKPNATYRHQDRAKDFLRQNKDLLKIMNPDKELSLKKERKDRLGKRHYRFQQEFNGIPVYGRENLVHMNEDGTIYLFQGHHVPTPTMQDVNPELTLEQAVEVCFEALGKSFGENFKAELVIYFDDNSNKDFLAWHIDAYPSFDEAWRFFIDAKTGAVITKYSIVMKEAVNASGLDLNSVTQSFKAWHQSPYYYMYDVTRPLDDSLSWAGVDTGVGDIQIYDGRDGSIPSSLTQSSGWDPSAVSLVANIYKVLDYYKNIHNRDGIDGANGHVSSFIHIGTAAWSTAGYMFFGDDQTSLTKIPAGLDVVAHEMAHGITQFTANLEYRYQSGAVNESMSDFFAAMVDRDDWILGEDVWLSNGGVMRDMSNPHNSDPVAAAGYQQPAKMSEYVNVSIDNGGVHINSGIPNRAVYLVAEGLSSEGLGTSIGKDKTEQIWYRALTVYLSPYSTFLDARIATLAAAMDLYGSGSTEELSVSRAWDIVEVLESNTAVPSSDKPTSTDAINGEDRLVYVWNGGVYVQDSTGTAYGPWNLYSAREARPAVYHGTNESVVFYVDSSLHSIRAISLDTGVDELIDDSFGWWALSLSHDGSRIAAVSDIEEPYIYVDDGINFHAFELYSPVIDSDTVDSTFIAGADVLSFDFQGRYLIYDYLTRITSSLGTSEFWRVGVLDVVDGDISLLTNDTDPSWQLGNPVFAANNDYIIAFDYLETATGASATFTLNAYAGTIGYVIAPDLDGFDSGALGFPTFRGDDGAIAVQTIGTLCNPYCSTVRAVALIPIIKEANGTWSGDQTNAYFLSETEGQYPLMYRAGPRIINPELSVSTQTVDFGVVSSETKTQTLTLTNTGNIDLSITGFELSGAGFSHNGSGVFMPRSSTLTITIAFDPNGLAGTQAGSLSISTNAHIPAVLVNLTAEAVSISGMLSSPDFNADGSSDVLFQNSNDGRLLIWGMNNFARTLYFPKPLSNSWDVVGKGDFNGDKTTDVLYMKNDGTTAIAEITSSARSNLAFPGGINPVWSVQGVGDFNGDGTDDILWRRSTDGVTMIWGIVNSSRNKVSWPGGLASFWDIVGTGDFDDDGIDDILCQHNSDGRLLIWKLNNYGRAEVKLPQSLANTWTVVGVGDFNDDGTDDVLYRKNTGDTAVAEFTSLNRSAIKFPGGIGLPWSVKDVGDYDGDGTDDIFFRRSTDGVTLAWGIVNSTRFKVAWPGALATQWQVQ